MCPILENAPAIKAIVDYTGLDRHQVAAIENEVKYIPLKALSRYATI